MLDGGGSGVPGQFIAYNLDPREALAEALDPSGKLAEAAR